MLTAVRAPTARARGDRCEWQRARGKSGVRAEVERSRPRDPASKAGYLRCGIELFPVFMAPPLRAVDHVPTVR